MLVGKKLDLRLHECQGRPQLMRGVSGELLLCRKRVIQSLEHIVERPAQLSEFGQPVVPDPHISQIVHLYLFHL